ncbi:hypothetical protein DFS34DRAFT_288878 [Phlyctochytrium arcticum]|nr:hypothetical protein DFS34DRAFT_288878 [Phlyctochytrium arcticum]
MVCNGCWILLRCPRLSQSVSCRLAIFSFPRSQISNISSTIVLPILESLRLWLINPLTPAHLFAATEALACICAAPSAASFETLCTPDLFPQFAQSILTTDRLIWFRVLEAMKTALRWVEDPALLVTGIKYRESREESFARAFAFFWCALESVQSAAGAAGVKEDYLYGLLDIMAILAGRSKIHTLNLWMVSVILQMLHQFGFNCRPIKIPVLPWQDEQNGGEKWHGFPSVSTIDDGTWYSSQLNR